MVSFAALLAQHLVRRGLHGSAFAQAVGYNQSYLSKILRGQKPPPLAMLDGWSRHLDLTPEEARQLRLAALVALAPSELATALEDFARVQRPRLREGAAPSDADLLGGLLLAEEDTGALAHLLGRRRRR